jgi:hypothetical protein
MNVTAGSGCGETVTECYYPQFYPCRSRRRVQRCHIAVTVTLGFKSWWEHGSYKYIALPLMMTEFDNRRIGVSFLTQTENFPFIAVSRSTLRPIHPPIQDASSSIFSGTKLSWLEAGHSSSLIYKIKITRLCLLPLLQTTVTYRYFQSTLSRQGGGRCLAFLLTYALSPSLQ